MDRVLKEERNYILQLVKKIKASGCNVLLIQKSILRDATTDLSLHYLVRGARWLLIALSTHRLLLKKALLVFACDTSFPSWLVHWLP